MTRSGWPRGLATVLGIALVAAACSSGSETVDPPPRAPARRALRRRGAPPRRVGQPRAEAPPRCPDRCRTTAPSASASSRTSRTRRRSSASTTADLLSMPLPSADVAGRSRSTPAPTRSRRSSPAPSTSPTSGRTRRSTRYAKSKGEALRDRRRHDVGRRVPRGQARASRRGGPEGQDARHPVSSATPRTSRCAPGSRSQGLETDTAGGGDVRSSRRRTPTTLETFKAGDDRRRLGARAVGDPADQGGRRQGARRRARPVARGQVRHHPPDRAHQVPRGAPGRRQAAIGASVDAIDKITPTRPRRRATVTRRSSAHHQAARRRLLDQALGEPDLHRSTRSPRRCRVRRPTPRSACWTRST